MAPTARGSNLVSQGEELPRASQIYREASWQFVGSETRSERDLSEEPASSYGEEADMIEGLDREAYDYEKQPQLESPDDHEDILHPLREAANRVGREVERFAEVLDGYNPLRATAAYEKYEKTLELIELYYGIAHETLDRLREQHASERRKGDDIKWWKKKMRGFTITQDQEDMDVEEFDERDDLSPRPQTTLEDVQRWEQETQTWDLLRRLVPLRFPPPGVNANPTRPTSQNPKHRYASNREVWDTFLGTDNLALERKTVLEWLKDTAEDLGENIDVLVQDLQRNADRGDIVAHGWLHTKAAIKNQKRLHGWSQSLDPASPEVQMGHLNVSKTEPLVTHLDPDSTSRQNRSLEPQDQYFERAIWLGCYEWLRRGRRPAEIREWCMERTELWRAVTLSGLPDECSQEEEEFASPASSALWRRMCFALARKGGDDEYERAVYGVLSGDISSVEPVCQCWDDFVFTHYNALLRTQFDIYLRTLIPQQGSLGTLTSFGAFDAVQYHGDPSTTGKRLIETLKTDVRTAKETLQPMKMLQGVLIADEFDKFIYQQGLVLAKFANAGGVSNLIPATKEQPEDEDIDRYVSLDDHDSLRVLTHVLLVFMSLGLDLGGASRRGVIENVIVSYISFLRLAGKEELIPLYCAQLSGARRYATLSRNLIDITDPEQRLIQIKLMRELGLDVQEFVKFQSRYLFADYPDENEDYPATKNFRLLEDNSGQEANGRRIRSDFFGDDSVERVDMLFIRSLEWYLLVDGLWSETFTIGTMLYMRFFKHMRLTAAKRLATRVSSSDISKSKTHAILGQSHDMFASESDVDDEELTEVLDGSANQKRLMKKYLLAEAKSFRELEALIISLDNMETLRSMGDLLNEDSSPKWQKEWRQALARAVQPTKAAIQPLLRGWLLTSQQEIPEFSLLREAYLPETILAYVSSLQFAGTVLTRDLLMECMDLSALVAAERSDLLELFVKTGRMEELVEAFALASKTLLILTANKRGSGSRSKKLRARGWTQELWTVKS